MLFATVIVYIFGLLLLAVMASVVWAVSNDDRTERTVAKIRKLRAGVRK